MRISDTGEIIYPLVVKPCGKYVQLLLREVMWKDAKHVDNINYTYDLMCESNNWSATCKLVRQRILTILTYSVCTLINNFVVKAGNFQFWDEPIKPGFHSIQHGKHRDPACNNLWKMNWSCRRGPAHRLYSRPISAKCNSGIVFGSRSGHGRFESLPRKDCIS